MRFLDLSPREYEPPSLCHTGIETLFAVGAGAAEAAAAGTAAAVTAAEVGTTAAVLGSWSPLAAAAPAAASFALPSLSTLGTVASVAGTGLQVLAQGDQAAYEEAVAKNNAASLRIKAGEEAAAAQRRQITAERQTGLLTSRARALAADSGTLATSPTEIENEAKIAQYGEYNALSSLYEGLAASRADNFQADIELFKAKRVASAAPIAQGATLLSGLSSFATRKAVLKEFARDPDRAGGFF